MKMQLKKTLLAIGIAVTTMLVPSLVYGQAYGKVNVETLNMRQEPNTKATNVGQLNQKDEVQIIGRANEEWLQVKGKDGKSAYVFSEYVSIEEAEGVIIGQGVRLRDYPATTGSNVFDTLSKGDKVVIQYTVDGWCKVIHDGREGFVSAEYVDSKFMDEIKSESISEVKRIVPTKVEVPAQTESTASKNNASGSSSSNSTTKPVESSESLADTIIEDAKQFLGNPYVYGGNSLTNGVDCSGFTQQIMKRHGISISRTSSSQYTNDGYKVSRDELRKGDLVFFGYNGSISHVGIYIGNGQMIHSGTSSTGITISSLEGVGKPYIGAKRVL
jgi:cell wall-associated NlpC family hydrolase